MERLQATVEARGFGMWGRNKTLRPVGCLFIYIFSQSLIALTLVITCYVKGIAQENKVLCLCSNSSNDTIIVPHFDFSIQEVRNAPFKVIIKNEADFEGVIFPKHADFSGVVFLENANFDNTILFHGGFIRDTFMKNVNFTSAIFNFGGAFKWGKFLEQADFSKASFQRMADFSSASFQQAVFDRTFFWKEANFDLSEFLHLPGKDSPTFMSFTRLNFDSVRFSFNHTKLPDLIDFSYNPSIKNDIDLTLADFSIDTVITKDKQNLLRSCSRVINGIAAIYIDPHSNDSERRIYHKIRLFNSEIGKFHMDYAHFKLSFEDIGADTAKKESILLKNDKIDAMYENLLKNFKDRGQIDDAERLDLEYRWFKANRQNGWMKFWSGYIPDWWWRFGYEKGRVFVHIVIFLLLFAIFTCWFLPYLHTHVYPLEAITKREGGVSQEINPSQINHVWPIDRGASKKSTQLEATTPNIKHWRFKKRLFYSIVYTCTIFFVFTLKSENFLFLQKQPGRWGKLQVVLGTLYVVVVSGIGLLCLGYAANFVLQR